MKHGRIAMDDKDIAALCRMVQGAKTHVEIGTLWGGSAIETAKANLELEIWCIDPFDGYYGKADPYTGSGKPTLTLVQENMDDAGVADRVHLVQAGSYPFPLELTFDTGLIDGDHRPEAVQRDIESLKACCNRIAVHDSNDAAIRNVIIEMLADDPAWRWMDGTDRMVVFEKVTE